MKNLNMLLPTKTVATDTWVWATVTQHSPLRVRLDGDEVALDVTPEYLFPGEPVVGSRVWVQMNGLRVIVHGPTKGVDFTPQIDVALQNAQQYADEQIEIAVESIPGDIATATQDAKDYADDQLADEAATINADIATVKSGASIAPNAIKASQLDADAITAKHTITGAILQTHTAGARGIKIVSSSNGGYGSIIGYNALGLPSFTLNGQTGVFSTTGAITTGGEITGATVTGGVVQTVATAFRGIKMVNNKLLVYPNDATSDANANLVIDGTTGSISMKGSITSGSTITGATITGGKVETVAGNGSKATLEAGSLKMFSNLAGEVATGGMTAGSWVWNGVTAAQTTIESPRVSGNAAARTRVWQGNDGKAGAEMWASSDTNIAIDDTSGLIHMNARAGGMMFNGKLMNLRQPVNWRSGYYVGISTGATYVNPGVGWTTAYYKDWIAVPAGARYAHFSFNARANTNVAADTDAYWRMMLWSPTRPTQFEAAATYAHNQSDRYADMGGHMDGWWNVESDTSVHFTVHAQATGAGAVGFRGSMLHITWFS